MNIGTINSLGKRAIGTRCFEWRPGMLVLGKESFRIVSLSQGYAVALDQQNASFIGKLASGSSFTQVLDDSFFSDIIPDCSDPATIGCLLYLVRQLYEMPTIWTVERDGIWYTCWSGATHGGVLGSGASEAEALVSALEDFDYSTNEVKK